jgi:hypothetical protein
MHSFISLDFPSVIAYNTHMKYCVQCGKPLADEALFCIHCGERQGEPAYMPPAPEVTLPALPKGARGMSLMSFALGLASLLACIFAFLVGMVAVVLGALAVREQRKDGLSVGLPLAGIVLGALGFVIGILLIVPIGNALSGIDWDGILLP